MPVDLSTAKSVELALAAEHVGKSLLKVASLEDLSPGCLANCIPLVVDETPGGAQCLSLTSSKEGTMPSSALPNKNLMQQRSQGAMQKKRIAVMVDDLCMPMLPEIAEEPGSLFSNAPSRFHTAAGSSSGPKNGHFEALLAAQLQLRRPPAMSCPTFPATAASCLKSPDLCLLSSKSQVLEARLLDAWETFVKAEKRSQQGTPLRLVASTKARSAMAAIMMEDSGCVPENSGLEVLEQGLAEPHILEPCFTLPESVARVGKSFHSWTGSDLHVDQYCSDAAAVIGTAMSLATEMGLGLGHEL